MATRNPCSISSGRMYGMYSCGLEWWMKNPGKPPNPRSGLHRRWFMSLRFAGIHNRYVTRFDFGEDKIRKSFLDPHGYNAMVWRGGIDVLAEDRVLVFDVRERSHYDADCGLTTVDEFRADWTPHADLGFLGSPSETEWMEPCVHLGPQLEWAEHALSGTPGVHVLLVRKHVHRRYLETSRPPDDSGSVSLLLFEPWQWAAFHATLHSLCAPYLAGVPAFG